MSDLERRIQDQEPLERLSVHALRKLIENDDEWLALFGLTELAPQVRERVERARQVLQEKLRGQLDSQD